MTSYSNKSPDKSRFSEFCTIYNFLNRDFFSTVDSLTTEEHIFSWMIGPNVLVHVSTLLRTVGTVGALKLGFFPALVTGVSQQSRPMLIRLATLITGKQESRVPLVEPCGWVFVKLELQWYQFTDGAAWLKSPCKLKVNVCEFWQRLAFLIFYPILTYRICKQDRWR